MVSVQPNHQLTKSGWRWHPTEPDTEHELSNETRILVYGDGLRIEQNITGCADVIHLNQDEISKLYAYLEQYRTKGELK